MKSLSTQLFAVLKRDKVIQAPQVNTADILSLIQREMLQQLLNAETDSFLGRTKYQRMAAEDVSEEDFVGAKESEEKLYSEAEPQDPVSQSRNYRKGNYRRKLRTETGDITAAMPRDRRGGFDSVITPKGIRGLAGLKDKILMFISGGNSIQECSRILRSMTGAEVSHEYIHPVV